MTTVKLVDLPPTGLSAEQLLEIVESVKFGCKDAGERDALTPLWYGRLANGGELAVWARPDDPTLVTFGFRHARKWAVAPRPKEHLVADPEGALRLTLADARATMALVGPAPGSPTQATRIVFEPR